MPKRKTYLYKGREATRLRSSDKTYTFSSAGSQYVRQVLEYAFLSGDLCKAFGPKAACDYAIELTLGHCGYCGLQLIVFITVELLGDGLLREKGENGYGRPIPVTDAELGWSIKMANFQFDHLFPASEGGLAVKGNIILACDTCNNAKSNMSAHDYIVRIHTIRDAQIRRGDKNVQPVFIEDLNEHLQFFESCVSTYYESSKKIDPEAVRLFDNATGFDSGRMMRELGHIDGRRIMGMDDPYSYALYPKNHELRDLPHMTNKELNDIAQERIARNRLLSDDSNRSLSFDYTDNYRGRYSDWALAVKADCGGNRKSNGVLSKAELQNIARNDLGGLNLDVDAERMARMAGGDLTAGLYQGLEPVLRRKIAEDDRRNAENCGNENYRSDIYAQAKRTFRTAPRFLFRLDKDLVMPSKGAFRRLSGMDGSKPVPYDVWEALLTINNRLATTGDNSTNDDYLIDMCDLVVGRNWTKNDLMREFDNGNLARLEIRMHYRGTPKSERTVHKNGSNDGSGYSGFYNSVRSRTRNWKKAWSRVHGGSGMSYEGPAFHEMLRDLGAEASLTYNDLEKPYNELKASMGGKRNMKYKTLDEKWIRSGVIDFEHGPDGLNKSIERYVESKDGLSSKKREKYRNKFYDVRKAAHLLTQVIARKVGDGGPDDDWAKRGWTSTPLADSDIASWPTLPTGYTSDNIGDLVDSEWARSLFVRYLDNTEPSKRSEVGKMIDSMNSILSELAASKDESPVKFIPNDREQSYIFWRMINKGVEIPSHSRSDWNTQVRSLFNMKGKRLFRYTESGNGSNSYDLILNLSSFPNVDYVDLCEAMSEPSGYSRVQFTTLDNVVDLVGFEEDLRNAEDEDDVTIAIMAASVKIYCKVTGGIPYSRMARMGSDERESKYGIVANNLKTFKFYLTRIHKEIPSSLIAHIPSSLMRMADYEARHHGIIALKNATIRRQN